MPPSSTSHQPCRFHAKSYNQAHTHTHTDVTMAMATQNTEQDGARSGALRGATPRAVNAAL
jgi:hypothetical protein